MKKKYIILFVILLLIFMALLISVKTGIAHNIDNYLYDIIRNWQNEKLVQIFKVITNLGGTISLFCITVSTVFVLILYNKKKEGIAVALNIMISSLTYFTLKNIIQRPRPPIEERLIEKTGYSFPSGHTTNNVAFYIFAIYLVYQNVENKKLRNLLCFILGIIPILIGFSRIYLRVHYVSDVVAGLCVGIMCVLVFMSLVYTKIK